MEMADYRDYGYMRGSSTIQTSINTAERGQVYKVTHEGEKYLPFMNRSFISFSFGGKNIEEFNLIATTSGDRLQRSGYASFEDRVTSFDAVDGQLYWGTRFANNEISFELSTDGISQQELDDFLYWFSPGQNRELILAEHPNRAIIARVKEPPELELLPFEDVITVEFGGQTFNTSTTKYKGEIGLSLTMDEPFWYAKTNIFGFLDNSGIYHDTWVDANGEVVSVEGDPDALKVAFEDGIPFSSMLQVSLLLGNNTFANLDSEANAIISLNPASSITATYDPDNGNITIVAIDQITEATQSAILSYGSTATLSSEMLWRAIAFSSTAPLTSYEYTNQGDHLINSTDTTDEIYNKLLAIINESGSDNTFTKTGDMSTGIWDINPRSRIARTQNEQWEIGAKIAGAVMDATSGIASMTNRDRGYFYYAGTAPACPIIRFTLTPKLNNAALVEVPYNTDTNPTQPYNTFTIESTTQHSFTFTTPNFYTSYNQAQKILATAYIGQSWESIRELIRANVNHVQVRRWAVKVIDSVDPNKTEQVNPSTSSKVRTRMSLMLKDKTTSLALFKAQFEFNSKLGMSHGTIKCRTIGAAVKPSDDDDWWNYSAGDITTLEEDTGDMLQSKYLMITDRNYPDEHGYIRAWQDNDISTHKYSHILYHDVSNGLENIFIEYQNMYL